MLAAAAAIGLWGCGGEETDEPAPPRERAVQPAPPPPGWRTVENARAGFSVAAPRRWTARTRDGATLLRSADQLAVLTVAADRSRIGRRLQPVRYARRALQALPGFEGSLLPGERPVRGSRYASARVDGTGVLPNNRQPQRITVAAFQRPGRVTYAIVAFRNARAPRAGNERAIARILRSFRAGRRSEAGG